MMNNTNLNKADFAGTIWGNLTIWRTFMKYWYFRMYSSPLMNLASTRASLAEGCSHNICKFKSRSPCFGSAVSGGNASRSFRRETFQLKWGEKMLSESESCSICGPSQCYWHYIFTSWQFIWIPSFPMHFSFVWNINTRTLNIRQTVGRQYGLGIQYFLLLSSSTRRSSWETLIISLVSDSSNVAIGPAVRIIISSTVRYNEGKCSRKKVRLITMRCVWHVEKWKQMYPNQVAD